MVSRALSVRKCDLPQCPTAYLCNEDPMTGYNISDRPSLPGNRRSRSRVATDATLPLFDPSSASASRKPSMYIGHRPFSHSLNRVSSPSDRIELAQLRDCQPFIDFLETTLLFLQLEGEEYPSHLMNYLSGQTSALFTAQYELPAGCNVCEILCEVLPARPELMPRSLPFGPYAPKEQIVQKLETLFANVASPAALAEHAGRRSDLGRLEAELNEWVNEADDARKSERNEARHSILANAVTKGSVLALDGCDEIPTCVRKFTHLRSLSITGQNIQKLPNFIGRLTFLEHLHLECRNLKQLPAGLYKLRSLNVSIMYCDKLFTVKGDMLKFVLSEVASVKITTSPDQILPWWVRELSFSIETLTGGRDQSDGQRLVHIRTLGRVPPGSH